MIVEERTEIVKRYIADDGMVFESEDNCLRHERNYKRKMLEEKLQPLKLPDNLFPPLCSENNDSYLYEWYLITTDEERNLLAEYLPDQKDQIYELTLPTIISIENTDYSIDNYMFELDNDAVYLKEYFERLGIAVQLKPIKNDTITTVAMKVISDSICSSIAKKAYSLYKTDWCASHNTTPEELETRENPKEMFVSYEEFFNNEAMEPDIIKEYIPDKNEFSNYLYYLKYLKKE